MRRSPVILAAVICLLAVQPSGAAVVVTVDAHTNLRELARDHLQDADAWPQILRANGLDSPDQLTPGQRILIPVGQVLDVDRSLARLRELIYRSTEIGAQVLATEAIGDAVAKEAEAGVARREGRLAEAAALLEAGIASAERALAASRASRDAAAQAILDAARGTVQRRRPDEFDWTSIPVRTLLAELERIRTLSRSSALVRFRDASSLRLNENAQLAIRRLRRDDLTSREQVDVVLYSGDLRALIESGGGREAVRVQVPGIETGIRSNHYWLQKAGQTTRVANYDGEIQVSAGGDSVVVRENQGTLVAGARPAPPVDLLPAPALVTPGEGQRVFGTEVELSWQPVARAAAYWLEVARDRPFADLVLTQTGLPTNGYRVALAEGVYYWRVSAVDVAGLPGPASDARGLQVLRDTLAPYLVVTRPAQDAVITDDARLTLSGRLEVGATLAVAGQPVAPGSDGTFDVALALTEGLNRIPLEARDAAGNASRLEWRVNYHPRSDLPLQVDRDLPRDDAGILLVGRTPFGLVGSTLPGAEVGVTGPDLAASVTADAQGRFALTLPARAEPTTFELTASGQLGQVARLPVRVRLDDQPPRIIVDAPPPEATATPELRLSGRVEGAVALTHAGRPLALAADGGFVLQLALLPGDNRVVLQARDAAGNVADWACSVRLDREPPVLDAERVSEQTTEGGRRVQVEIQAHDQSGITAVIPYQLAIGDRVLQGTLSRCPDRTCYRGQLFVPATVQGRPRLRSVSLQDYLGNHREVRLD